MPMNTSRDAADAFERCDPSPDGARTETSTSDFCLADEQGRRIGAVRAARMQPALGKDAPTVLVNQKRPSMQPR